MDTENWKVDILKQLKFMYILYRRYQK